MEQHPVPQNVTTFQFKLIGDMTLKQFLYLATGSVIAYCLFIFAASKYPYISWPLIIISSLTGAAFAFLPIQERPLDQWVGAFFNAIYSPTKRVWKKGDKTYIDYPLFQSRYLTYISGINQSELPSSKAAGYPPESSSTNKAAIISKTQPSPAAPIVAELPTHQELKDTVDLAKQAQNLQMKIIQTERQLSQIKQAALTTQQLPPDYSSQVNLVISNLQTLINQASEVKQKMGHPETPQLQTIPQPIQPAVKPNVKIITPEKTKQTQLALTTFPNVINGVIKDTQSNYLDAVVVVIYDKEGLPVRALKTNKLGQFTGSTPLHNGTYKIEMEKEGYTFDVLQIELTGQVLAPLMITAKGASN